MRFWGFRTCADTDLRIRVRTPSRIVGSTVIPFDITIGQVRPVAKRRFRKVATMTLITAEQRAQLLANGQARAEGRDIDPPPVVKLFTPDAHATWLLTELDPADADTAYGLCDLGIGMPEKGTVKLSDLATIVGPLKRPLLRDLHFRATRTLSEYARLARLNGSIID